jgi:hypothetical protein
VFLGDTILGMSRLTAVQDISFDINARHKGIMTLDDTQPSHSYTIEQAGDPSMQIVTEQNTTADQFMDHLRACDTVYARIVATGGAIETGFTYRVQITMPCKFANPQRGDRDGVYAGTYDLAAIIDSGLGSYIEIVVDTALAAL